MDLEDIRESVLRILVELHGNIDYEAEEKMVDDKILDSFDMATLISELAEEFEVEIDSDKCTADHFNSLDALTEMIADLLEA